MTYAKKQSKRDKPGAAKVSRASSYFLEDILKLAETLANRRKDWGAEKISEFAESVSEFATSAVPSANFGNFVNPAIEYLEEFADYVRKTEVDQIVRDTTTFARRHPIFTIGGGILAGLIVTQILHSSETTHKATRATNSTRKPGGRRNIRKTHTSKSKKSSGNAQLNRKPNGHAHINT